MTALTGRPMGVLQVPIVSELARALVAEGVAAGMAAGADLSTDDIERTLAVFAGLPPDNGTQLGDHAFPQPARTPRPDHADAEVDQLFATAEDDVAVEAHQESHLVRRSAPVLGREGVGRQIRATDMGEPPVFGTANTAAEGDIPTGNEIGGDSVNKNSN